MNKYLEKIALHEKEALRRIVSEIAKGTVTTPLKELVGKGFVKSRAAYAKGMNEGNKAILSKMTGVQVYRPKTPSDKALSAQGGGFATVNRHSGRIDVMHEGKKSIAHYILGTRNTHDVYTPAMIRHELFEARDMQHLSKEGLRPSGRRSSILNSVSDAMRGYKVPESAVREQRVALTHALRHVKPVAFGSFRNQHGAPVGAHATPRVLSQESEMVRKNPYLSHLRETRESLGEASIVKDITGKRFGIDKMTGKDHRKAFYTKPKDVDNSVGMNQPVYQAKP